MNAICQLSVRTSLRRYDNGFEGGLVRDSYEDVVLPWRRSRGRRWRRAKGQNGRPNQSAGGHDVLSGGAGTLHSRAASIADAAGGLGSTEDLLDPPAIPLAKVVGVRANLHEQGMLGRRGLDQKLFSLCLALILPYTPMVPANEWQGKIPLGPCGEFVMETDWAVSQVLRAIDYARLRENTLVIFTIENGCAIYIDVQQLEALRRYASSQFRGYKPCTWNGGYRSPFLVWWPEKVKADSDRIICLSDLLATCADILGVKPRENASENSVSILPALLGTDHGPLHEIIVNHSVNGRFAIRQAKWNCAPVPAAGTSMKVRPLSNKVRRRSSFTDCTRISAGAQPAGQRSQGHRAPDRAF